MKNNSQPTIPISMPNDLPDLFATTTTTTLKNLNIAIHDVSESNQNRASVSASILGNLKVNPLNMDLILQQPDLVSSIVQLAGIDPKDISVYGRTCKKEGVYLLSALLRHAESIDHVPHGFHLSTLSESNRGAMFNVAMRLARSALSVNAVPNEYLLKSLDLLDKFPSVRENRVLMMAHPGLLETMLRVAQGNFCLSVSNFLRSEMGENSLAKSNKSPLHTVWYFRGSYLRAIRLFLQCDTSAALASKNIGALNILKEIILEKVTTDGDAKYSEEVSSKQLAFMCMLRITKLASHDSIKNVVDLMFTPPSIFASLTSFVEEYDPNDGKKLLEGEFSNLVDGGIYRWIHYLSLHAKFSGHKEFFKPVIESIERVYCQVGDGGGANLHLYMKERYYFLRALRNLGMSETVRNHFFATGGSGVDAKFNFLKFLTIQTKYVKGLSTKGELVGDEQIFEQLQSTLANFLRNGEFLRACVANYSSPLQPFIASDKLKDKANDLPLNYLEKLTGVNAHASIGSTLSDLFNPRMFLSILQEGQLPTNLLSNAFGIVMNLLNTDNDAAFSGELFNDVFSDVNSFLHTFAFPKISKLSEKQFENMDVVKLHMTKAKLHQNIKNCFLRGPGNEFMKALATSEPEKMLDGHGWRNGIEDVKEGQKMLENCFWVKFNHHQEKSNEFTPINSEFQQDAFLVNGFDVDKKRKKIVGHNGLPQGIKVFSFSDAIKSLHESTSRFDFGEIDYAEILYVKRGGGVLGLSRLVNGKVVNQGNFEKTNLLSGDVYELGGEVKSVAEIYRGGGGVGFEEGAVLHVEVIIKFE